ncbi:MAG: hypothetical protein J6S45_05505, partial [Firmicutes bacterium]|nr:hypothetical protein [Bacillota bacterium]
IMSEIKLFMEEQKLRLEREIAYRQRMLNLLPKGSLLVRVRGNHRYLCLHFKDKSGNHHEDVLHETDRKLAERIQLRFIS